MERYYYKSIDGNCLMNLKKPIDDTNYIQITEEEYNELTKIPEPSEEQKAINEARAYLESTDYITDKFVQAIVEGNTTELEELKQIYAPVLVKRREARVVINNLQG